MPVMLCFTVISECPKIITMLHRKIILNLIEVTNLKREDWTTKTSREEHGSRQETEYGAKP